MALLCYAYVLLVCCIGASGRATPAAAVIDYLRTYGYLTEDGINKSEEITSLGLTKFQTKMGIIANGKLDSITENLIHSPRCGERDIYPDKTKVRSLIEKISKTGEVRYKIEEWTTKWLPRTIQNQTIYNMLKLWADDLAVKVVWSPTKPDVNIVFRPGKKRRNGIHIASKYDVFSELNFQDDMFTVTFYSKAAQSLNILTRTSAHAFGHVFGHEHTNLYSIMSPIIRSDDIMSHRKCEISITAAFSHVNSGTSYLIKEDMAWKILEEPTYTLVYPPVKISEMSQGVPDNFDDAFTWGKNWRTYIFKGSSYYRLGSDSRPVVDEGYPQPIAEGWPGVPDDIDAAFTDRNMTTYFFKGELTYKYDDEEERVADGYPKRISDEFGDFKKLASPGHFDAVFHYYMDDAVYFYKGLYYWKMDRYNGNAILGPFIIKYDWKNLCIPDGDVF